MRLGKVIGTVVSSTQAKDYESRKILVIQPLDADKKPAGTSFLAIDTVQAGVGDIVFTIEEGNSARAVIADADALTIKTVVAAIVDHISK
ncbi:MAG: EutN/CcmL family microcompartment protein [Bacteroidales bacterium]|nr:EutN/CcmL family microcompartment protein [Bacteroidales bacterium]